MKVQRLQVEQQMAKISVDSQMASLKIDTAQRRMRVEQEDAQLSVNKTPSQIDLDIRGFFDDLGLRSPQSFSQQRTIEAQSDIQNTIKQIVQDGKFVAEQPPSDNRIGQLAKKKMLKSSVEEISGSVPKGPIGMKGIPGKIDINWSKNDVRIVWDEFQTPKIKVEPKASVKVHLEQEPRVEFKVVELEIPPDLGAALDAEA